MKKSKILILTLFTVIGSALIFSCKKDKESKPIVAVSPAATYYYSNVGDLIAFNIDVTSEVSLSKVTITSQADNETPVTVKDTAISSKGTSFYYYYKVPASMAGRSIIFDFYAEDEKGKYGRSVKKVYVTAANPIHPIALTETAGHRLYSNLSINADAYNLETNSPEFSSIADSTFRDIQDNSGVNTTLSNSWKTPAVGKFVAYNGFDYANATDSSLFNGYTSGVKLSLLNNIQIGDIIITKLGSMTANKYVLMRITDIVDAVGKDSDYYEFTIKK